MRVLYIFAMVTVLAGCTSQKDTGTLADVPTLPDVETTDDMSEFEKAKKAVRQMRGMEDGEAEGTDAN